jgi:pyruvate,water dikinase
MEVGGIVSHGAIVSREYGLPAVVGVKDATRILRQGEIIELNGSTGEIVRVRQPVAERPEAAVAMAAK